MEYTGRLFAKVGTKYVPISHSDEFDKYVNENIKLLELIESIKLALIFADNDSDKKLVELIEEKLNNINK